MSIKACIFDLDGVLVDTAGYHFLAWRRLAREWGYELTEEQNEKLKGISRAESLERLLEWAGYYMTADEKTEAMDRKNRWYLELIQNMTPAEVLPGALDFVTAVRLAGLKTGLGSASRNAGVILHQTGLDKLLDVVVDGNHITRGKPDPQTFALGADALGVDRGETVVFEDAEAGVEAALAGGMKCVGVGSPDVLGKAHRVVPNLKSLTVQEVLAL